jgi:hypothetical protein
LHYAHFIILHYVLHFVLCVTISFIVMSLSEVKCLQPLDWQQHELLIYLHENIMLPTKYDVALPNRQKVDHVCPKPIARMMLNDTCFRASLIWITLVGTHVQAKARALSSSP